MKTPLLLDTVASQSTECCLHKRRLLLSGPNGDGRAIDSTTFAYTSVEHARAIDSTTFTVVPLPSGRDRGLSKSVLQNAPHGVDTLV